MLVKKITAVLILAGAFIFSVHATEITDISAESSVLIDADTNEILFEKNSRARMSMASTTKIMTVLLATESDKLSDVVTVKEKLYIEGTAIGFEKGDKLTLEVLCYAALLESGNDAAVLIAGYLAGNEEKFSKLMNAKAEEIGMNDTNFVTASGLDEKEHYTTAYDMAILGSYAVKNEKFREICSTKTYKAEFISSNKVRYFSNHNKLMSSTEGVFGIKTGFTKKSGRCLVSACARNNKVLIAVTLKAPDDWNDHKKLYNYGYSLYKTEELNTAQKINDVNIIGSVKKSIKVCVTGNKSYEFLNNTDIKTVIKLKKFYYAPVSVNEILGEIEYYQNGKIVYSQTITAVEEAAVCNNTEPEKENIFKRILYDLTRKGR